MDTTLIVPVRANRRSVAAALATTAILLALPALQAHAQGKPAKPGAAPPPPGAKPGKPDPAAMAAREFARLEKVIGKPLTDAQKKSLMGAYMTEQAELKAARDKFNGAVAKSVGMTPDELKKKFAESRAKQQGGGPGMPPPPMKK